MKDGGPAFPIWTEDMPVEGSAGMSLRDYFAGQALAGIMANTRSTDPAICVERLAYEIADAMLAVREERS